MLQPHKLLILYPPPPPAPSFFAARPPYSGAVIGLLGGSFNPAHEGHLAISREALKRLGLDAVWWLVSPQNPLKSSADMADYPTRFASACAVAAAEPRIRVSDFEQQSGTRYTIDTIRAVQRRYPRIRFVWLMGADNLAQMHRWKDWHNLLPLVSIAICDRAPFSHRALRSVFALRYHAQRLSPRAFTKTVAAGQTGWCFLFIPRHAQSATQLRKTLGKEAYLRHNRNCEAS